jgi:hypothetical protein
MGTRQKDDWIRRFAFSLFFGGTSVIISTGFFIASASKTNSKAIELLSYVFAVPLLPGVGFVAMFFNAWQAVHQGQIALVPVVSVPVDSAIVFLVWHYFSQRKATPPEKHVTLHLS